MRVFLTPSVTRLTRQERLDVAVLCNVAREVLAGRLGAGEADLGGGVFKKRLARAGGGKRGEYRMIVAYRRPLTERVLFAFAFAKNSDEALTAHGLETFTAAAAEFVATSDEALDSMMAKGVVREIACDA